MTIFNEICKFKKALIKKAKTKGLYENFGQREINILVNKYGRLGLIVDFESWALNYDGSA
jgi:hypothetical protein